MNVNDAFPSNYLKATDLQNKEIPVTVSKVVMEKIGDDPRMIAYFAGKQKGVVVNKTNATNLSAAYGPETDHWVGKPVVLFSVWTDFQGKSVQAIRMRPGTAAPAPTTGPVPPSYQVDPRGPDLNDEVPF
jgi:hypothetical protein